MNISVKIGERRFEVTVGDLNERPIRAVLDGETFEVYPEPTATNGLATPRPTPQTAQSTASMPASAVVPKTSTNLIKAALPGVIASISVRSGETISAGQQICVIEAMKMQNVIRATRNGTIKEVLVTVGQTVKQRQPLVEYAPDES